MNPLQYKGQLYAFTFSKTFVLASRLTNMDVDVIRQCQRAALQCQRLEHKRLELLQSAADEIQRFSDQIRFLKKIKSTKLCLWTKSMKRKVDEFSPTAVSLNFQVNPLSVTTDENDDIHSFPSYNKLVAQYDSLLSSTQKTTMFLSAEINRLQQVTSTLTVYIQQEIDSRCTIWSHMFASAFVSRHCRSYGLDMYIDDISIHLLLCRSTVSSF